MKTSFHLLAATMAFVIAAVSVIVSTSSVWAQDPAVVNPKTIKVKFENERVRVLEAELPPGVKEQVHSHPAYVIYVLAGGKYRNYAADGKTTEGEMKTGDVLYREPLTHAAENIGTTTLHMILVELKGANAETLKN
jgi:quercetin dioxygenase-like cupin family protein